MGRPKKQDAIEMLPSGMMKITFDNGQAIVLDIKENKLFLCSANILVAKDTQI